MNSVKVQKILNLFLAFNHVEGGESLSIEENTYNDDFFRWKKGSFKHGKKFTVFFNKIGIIMFDTAKVVDRLTGNMDKIKSNKEKTKYGVNKGIVQDLIMVINIETVTDKEMLEIEERRKELKAIAEAKKREIKRKSCQCEKPLKRMKNSENGIFTYCATCAKQII